MTSLRAAELRALAEGDGEAEFEDRVEVVIGGCPWETVLALVDAVEAAQTLVERGISLAEVFAREKALIAALAPFSAVGEKEET